MVEGLMVTAYVEASKLILGRKAFLSCQGIGKAQEVARNVADGYGYERSHVC